MAASRHHYEGDDYLFDPKDLDSQEFLNTIGNPSVNANREVIKDVISEIQPAFAEEGVPQAVIDMLQKLWLQKLEKTSDPAFTEELDLTDSDASTVFHGFEAPLPSTSRCLAAPQPVSKKPKSSKKVKKIQQVDGPNDSSDSEEEINDEIDDDDDNDSDDDDDDDIDGDGDEEDGEGAEDEPLGSGDDISDGDPSDLFDTENVVVCQYDKIQRVRNKWKFHLKDGIMNLNGKDYVFQKATGEAEW